MIRNLEARVLTPKGNKMKGFFKASLSKQKYHKQTKQSTKQDNAEKYSSKKYTAVRHQKEIDNIGENQYGFPLFKNRKQLISPRVISNKPVTSLKRSSSLAQLEFTFGNC